MIEFYLCYRSIISFLQNLKNILFGNLFFFMFWLGVVWQLWLSVNRWFWWWNSSSFLNQPINELLLIIFGGEFDWILASSINILQITPQVKKIIEHVHPVGFDSIIQRGLSVIINHIMLRPIPFHQFNGFNLAQIDSIINSILPISVLVVHLQTLFH